MRSRANTPPSGAPASSTLPGASAPAPLRYQVDEAAFEQVHRKPASAGGVRQTRSGRPR